LKWNVQGDIFRGSLRLCEEMTFFWRR